MTDPGGEEGEVCQWVEGVGMVCTEPPLQKPTSTERKRIEVGELFPLYYILIYCTNTFSQNLRARFLKMCL
jgi:hypothetical protein